VKDAELRLIVELMKNSSRSGRELAKAVGTSQPTVGRLKKKLEKEGVIKEYTIIPDFGKLGFEIAAVTFLKFAKELSAEEYKELRSYSKGVEKKRTAPILMAMNGLGLGNNRVFVSFHKDYSSFMKDMREVKTFPYVDSSQVQSFLIDLKDEGHFQPPTLSLIAKYLSEAK
jgi:DNA-binding Lrp family transcriptional regulator